jgi:predicted nucleic acid-binding protein
VKVFLDTTPTYALLDARDQAHKRALAIFGQAAKDTLLTPLPTALELHGLLIKRKPSDPEAAHESVRSILRAYPLVFPTRDDTDAAADLLARYSDQRLTLTDALIASMAAREGARVLTFDDRHFSLMGSYLYGEQGT